MRKRVGVEYWREKKGRNYVPKRKPKPKPAKLQGEILDSTLGRNPNHRPIVETTKSVGLESARSPVLNPKPRAKTPPPNPTQPTGLQRLTEVAKDIRGRRPLLSLIEKRPFQTVIDSMEQPAPPQPQPPPKKKEEKPKPKEYAGKFFERAKAEKEMYRRGGDFDAVRVDIRDLCLIERDRAAAKP